MSDLASIAAATAAGYKYMTWTQSPTEFHSRFEKILRGANQGEDDAVFTAESWGPTQTASDTNALSALNAQRSERYGFAEPTTPSTDNTADGAVEVVDQT